MKRIAVLNVEWAGGDERRSIGRLAWSAAERRAYFEYAPAFLENPLPLSPFRLPVRPGAVAAPHAPFEGLHGLFNDSLPDGWGRRLLDRALARRDIDFRLLTPIDRLAFVGSRGMGALVYEPEQDLSPGSDGHRSLDWIAEQAELVLADITTREIDVLQGAQGGSAGARPKINIGIGPGDEVVLDYGSSLPDGFERWIVKFRGADDPKEIGSEEFAYALMARAAGVDMPETRLLETEGSGRFFAAKRFDRIGGRRVHVQSASALVEADHRAPSLDYETLLKITHVLTRDVRCVSEVFRRMAFNVLAHNRDDHAKNHAFRMDPSGSWTPTPAYDLTFSNGPGGEHNLAVAGEGRRPGVSHMLALAKRTVVGEAQAKAVIEEVATAVGRWLEFADRAGVPAKRARDIDAVLNPGHRSRIGPIS